MATMDTTNTTTNKTSVNVKDLIKIDIVSKIIGKKSQPAMAGESVQI